MIYLWLVADLTDPRCIPTPLATFRVDPGPLGDPQPHGFTWAPGEGPRYAYTYRDEFMREIIADLPVLVERGVRFNQGGMGAGNIQEGRPFTLDALRPGIRRALQSRRDWTWERHGPGHALYAGRGPMAHGLNVLSAANADAFDAYGEDTRDVIAALLNLVSENSS